MNTSDVILLTFFLLVLGMLADFVRDVIVIDKIGKAPKKELREALARMLDRLGLGLAKLCREFLDLWENAPLEYKLKASLNIGTAVFGLTTFAGMGVFSYLRTTFGSVAYFQSLLLFLLLAVVVLVLTVGWSCNFVFRHN